MGDERAQIRHQKAEGGRMKIKFFLAWYDIWIGIYISRKDKKAYICPFPCCVIMISLKEPQNER